MADFLYSVDVAVFRWINEGWSNSYLDRFFTYITNYHHFEIIILVIVSGLLVRGGRKGRWVVLALIITVTLTDQISAHLIKHIFDRIRPCNALTGVLAPDGKSSSFSFPSSHATNMGGSMTLLAMAYPAWAWFCALFAFLVGISRVYLGVHYPSDVLGGWILGIGIGWGMWKGTNRWALVQPQPALAVAPRVKPKVKKGKRRGRIER